MAKNPYFYTCILLDTAAPAETKHHKVMSILNSLARLFLASSDPAAAFAAMQSIVQHFPIVIITRFSREKINSPNIILSQKIDATIIQQFPAPKIFKVVILHKT